MASIDAIWASICPRRAMLHKRGDVTMVLSKKRRHDGPKGVKILVTTLTTMSAGALLSISARRWGVAGTIKARKSGMHLGQRQVTKERERVERSVIVSVVASL